jgi:hypothetical protein
MVAGWAMDRLQLLWHVKLGYLCEWIAHLRDDLLGNWSRAGQWAFSRRTATKDFNYIRTWWPVGREPVPVANLEGTASAESPDGRLY